MLLIDTNVLLRCSQGRGRVRLQTLLARSVRLATTDRNADEFGRKLVEVFGLEEGDAWAEVTRVLEAIEVILTGDYDHKRQTAELRLHEGGKSDWPALAAALALDGEIWSDDRDFFGVGVPVWSTPNVQSVPGDPA